jgi:hypothetical protein
MDIEAIKDEESWKDTTEVYFDGSMMFGLGYDMFGWHYLREEIDTPIGRFAIWPEYTCRKTWGMYGGVCYWSQFNLPSAQDARDSVYETVREHLLLLAGEKKLASGSWFLLNQRQK